jgi:hypothetical protein
MGGKPNFDGQANSLWLYQNGIGAVIYRGIQEVLCEAPPVALPPGATPPPPKVVPPTAA